MAAIKTCIGCKTARKATDYHKHKRSADGRCSRCKVCASAKTAAWRADNTDRAREYDRARWATPEYRERRLVYMRGYNAGRRAAKAAAS